MKIPSGIAFLFLYSFFLQAQTPVETILNHAEKIQIEQFDITDLNENQLFVAMPYSSNQFLNGLRTSAFRGSLVARVDLIYTAFPEKNEIRQHQLNKSRITALSRRLPTTGEVPLENWNLIEQTACTTEAQARAMPHGFLLTFSKPPILPDFTNEARLQILTEGDSTVLNTLSRNKDWKKMLVVTDLTGSMSPFTAQLLLWFKLAQNTGRVEHLVFFNDGDGKDDILKEIGKAGGIYDIKPKNFEDIARLANKVVEKGTGGDEPENNMEAVLYGLKVCPQCEEVVMISDNWATPRDIILLQQVNKPIRVILCDTEEGVNVDYLNLARSTGGSVHTIEEDIHDLLHVNEGQEIKIGKETFIVRNGKFELFKKM